MSEVLISPHPSQVVMKPQVKKPVDNEKAAKEFEGMFLKFFLKKMFPEGQGTLFGEGHSADFYKSFWIDAVAQSVSKNGGILKEYILKTMNRHSNEQVDMGGVHDSVI